MKIALVFPRFKYPSGDPPLGIAYIASVLKEKAGIDAEIIDTTFFRGDKHQFIDERFSGEPYDLVGISCMTTMINDGLDIARTIKSHHRETIIIFGGPHPTVMPEETLASPYVDAVCIGEGEETFCELVRNKGDFKGIDGIWYKGEEDDVIKNDPRKPIDDLDSLPFPALDLLPMEKYFQYWFQLDSVARNLKGVNILASRGCPYRCSFCQPTLSRLFGKKIRKRSPENITREIEYWKERHGINAVMFTDDTLTVDRNWVNELCSLFLHRNLDIIWGCNARVDLAAKDLFAKMKEAGLRKVFMGIESGSQRVLTDIYDKMITHEKVFRAVATAKSLGLRIQGYFMIGAPTETEEEIMKTIRLARDLDIDEATFSITTPLPGTSLYDRTREYISEDITDLDYYSRSLYNEKVSLGQKRLNRLKKKAFSAFYLSPRHIGYTIRSFAGITAAKRSLMKLRRFW